MNGHVSAQGSGRNIAGQDALAFAYQYGYPLFAYGRFSKKHRNTPNNTFIHERNLIKAGWTAVVRPNNDTLYTFAFCDLSQGDLCFEVPEFDHRYWAFSFYDLYANNYASIGSQTADRPGKYLLRYTKEGTSFGVTRNSSGEYAGCVDSPTVYGIFLARLATGHEDAEVKKVNGFQDAMKVSHVPRASGVLAPAFDRSIFDKVTGSEAEQTMQLTAALAPLNPPEVIEDRGWVASTLERAGILNGKWVQPPNTSLTDAVTTANMAPLALRTTAGFMRYLGNNWRSPSPLISGDFKSFYAARHLVAIRGYLQPTADQSAYPSWYPEEGFPQAGKTECTIGPKQAILFSFSGKPKLKNTGFWSLTLYNAETLLVPNKLDRYSLGDRSDLRYPDGVSLKDREDGRFEILVQPDDVAPPKRYANNWLPAPAGGGPISFTLRLFAPADQMFDGSYEYPKVTIVDAITE